MISVIDNMIWRSVHQPCVDKMSILHMTESDLYILLPELWYHVTLEGGGDQR